MNKPRHLRRWLLAGAAVVAFGAVATAMGTAGAAPVKQSHPAPVRKPPSNLAKAGAVVPDQYIVTLKNRTASATAVANTANTLSHGVGGVVKHTYSKALSGFVAHMTEAQAKAMAARPEVARVEPDRVMKALDTVTNAPWNLDRIDQPYLPLDTRYTAATSGSTVHAYVIDTGIHIAHSVFDGRAKYGYNAIDGTTNAEDCNGHGTHVSGTIGAAGFGVAEGVQLVAVKVLGWDNVNGVPDCSGNGIESQIIAGIDWVTTNAVTPAVANMSLGGEHSDLLDEAVARSIAAGITYSVAAGNDGLDSCVYDSPGDVPAAITVAATDRTDTRATFAPGLSSDYGPCVDIFAPGKDITSAWLGTGLNTISGTSMAAPHVTGAAALLLDANPGLTPQQVRDTLVSRAVTGAVDDPGVGSPNKLLQVEAAPAVAAQVIRLRSRANSQVVSADPNGTNPLVASRIQAGAWEEFDVVDAGGGWVALRSHANGKYVSADAAGAAPLVNNRSSAGAWEQFHLTTNADGSVSLLANANGRYVTADNGGTKPLMANRTTVGAWEEFDIAVATSSFSLASFANFDCVDQQSGAGFPPIVTADDAGTSPLIANRCGIGAWETFDAVDLGNGWLAFRAWANGKYVTADNAGTKPLIANRAAPGAWEEFKFGQNADGTVSILANANGKYVTAESAGTLPLIANRAAPGAWEEFAVIAS